MNLKNKIKTLVKKVVLWNAEMQVEAKEKRDQKREERKKKQERDESFYCPICRTIHTASYYYNHHTKKEDIKIKKEYNSSYINFVKCSSCGELMGVETTHYFEPGFDTYRSSFNPKDKEIN